MSVEARVNPDEFSMVRESLQLLVENLLYAHPDRDMVSNEAMRVARQLGTNVLDYSYESVVTKPIMVVGEHGVPDKPYNPGWSEYSPGEHVQGLTALIVRGSKFSWLDKASLIDGVVGKASSDVLDPEMGVFAKALQKRALSPHRARRAALKQLRSMATIDNNPAAYGSGMFDSLQAGIVLDELRSGWLLKSENVVLAAASLAGVLTAVALARKSRQ
jgi:hypothetical protein